MVSRSQNPVFNEKTFDRFAYLTGTAPAARMTVRGTLDRASILFFVAFGAAALSWSLVSSAHGLAFPAAIGGALVAFVLALVVSFNPTSAPYLSPVYAVFEGAFLGAISQVLETRYPNIAGQAVLGTGVITGVMLLLYRFRVIRATPTFRKVVISMTLAVAILYGVAFVAMLLGARVPFINDPSPLGIGLSLFLIGLAASNLILDFDLIEQGERTGAPKAMEWYAAFGLLVTVAWLYMEVLRLLSKMNRR